MLRLDLNIFRHSQLSEELQIHLTDLNYPASGRTGPETRNVYNVTASIEPRLTNSTVLIPRLQDDRQDYQQYSALF